MGAIDTSLGILYDMQVIVALLFGSESKALCDARLSYVPEPIKLLDIGYRYFVTDAVQVLQMLETGLLIQYRMDETQLFFTGVIALVTQQFVSSSRDAFYCWRICMLMKANGVPYPYVHTAILSLVSLGANGTWFAHGETISNNSWTCV
ncbi:hypothetical protein FISHEDRAFT_58679 [Fistulina hepatica ATCC 64428]|uniref:Uncharacterized protein n=1 Tax=Fistulina hepatica ATCC 64428 TaxID=1128425 RepID=A0A0D7AD83_9AGAR|nr:hypothetical protein FISHEDRAFT_58679 [Fistulina hepatica ATCC 64428]